MGCLCFKLVINKRVASFDGKGRIGGRGLKMGCGQRCKFDRSRNRQVQGPLQECQSTEERRRRRRRRRRRLLKSSGLQLHNRRFGSCFFRLCSTIGFPWYGDATWQYVRAWPWKDCYALVRVSIFLLTPPLFFFKFPFSGIIRCLVGCLVYIRRTVQFKKSTCRLYRNLVSKMVYIFGGKPRQNLRHPYHENMTLQRGSCGGRACPSQ